MTLFLFVWKVFLKVVLPGTLVNHLQRLRGCKAVTKNSPQNFGTVGLQKYVIRYRGLSAFFVLTRSMRPHGDLFFVDNIAIIITMEKS